MCGLPPAPWSFDRLGFGKKQAPVHDHARVHN
jgi:hypothetical protein